MLVQVIYQIEAVSAVIQMILKSFQHCPSIEKDSIEKYLNSSEEQENEPAGLQ